MSMSTNFISADRNTIYLLPPSVQDWLPEDHLARFVVDIVSQLDLRSITAQYGGRGSKAYHPRMLLALLFYGYATGVFSSRKIEQATYDSVAFRFIAANKHPDHDDFALAIAAYERSSEVQKYNSRFDSGDLSTQEETGYALFKVNCSKCHSADPGPNNTPPLFTDYSYHNIGLPANSLLADKGTDLGLGGFLRDDFNSDSPIIGDENYAEQYGNFKVPTLRNIAITPPYGHNGYFASLRDMVSFHNSRDTADWPAPEVTDNLDPVVGSLGLSEQEIDDIIAFLHSLTDRTRGQNKGQ